MSGKIRLACMYCDTEEFDGVDSIPDGWINVEFYQSYEESLVEVPTENANGKSVLDWYTHLGVCPKCNERRIIRTLNQ
jgi:hypothetical protein